MSLPSIRQILDIYGLRAQKHLSQNFLLRTHILERIAGLVPEDSIVVEIGPGPGSLTRSLLKRNPTRLVSIELDTRFQPALNQLQEMYPNVYFPIFADALNSGSFLDLPQLKDTSSSDTVAVVGNLPFGIASVLLQNLLSMFDKTISPTKPNRLFALMFQKEVAEVQITRIDGIYVG